MTERVGKRSPESGRDGGRPSPVKREPEQPLALPERRRTYDPLPEPLVRQRLRKAPWMDLHLTDEQSGLLLSELDRIIEIDRYPLSAPIRAGREIRAVPKPYPERMDQSNVSGNIPGHFPKPILQFCRGRIT